MEKSFNSVAIHHVKMHLLKELDKCNQERIIAEREKKNDDEIEIWKDKQIIYGMLCKNLDVLVRHFNENEPVNIELKSEDLRDNFIKFYKEDGRIWVSIGEGEERGFTTDEVKEIIDHLQECIQE